MTETPDERPRPTPRPRTAAAPRPSPRPRVAGARRDRDERPAWGDESPASAPEDAPTPAAAEAPAAEAVPGTRGRRGAASARRRSRPDRARTTPSARPRRRLPLVAVLAALCLVAAGVAALLYLRPPDRTYVDPDVFTAAQENMEAVYRYDYRDSDGSVADQLAVLTGDLREQYEVDAQGVLIDTYEQVSATIRYDVVEVGLQQVDADQEEATLVVFGQLVAKSVNTATQPAPEGSECVVTADGEQSCVRTVQIRMVRDGDEAWRIDELTVLTTG